MRITITDKAEKVVRTFEVNTGVANAIETLLLAIQPQPDLELQRGDDRLRDRCAILESLLNEALSGYVDIEKCSPRWLAEARGATKR